MAQVVTILRITLHTQPRALKGAPKPPHLGSVSGWTGQAAQSSKLDDLQPSGPPARLSPASGTHRGGTTVGAATFPVSQCCCRVLPFGSYRKQLPWQLLIASCHTQGAASGQAAPWTRATAWARTAALCASGGGLSSSPGRAQAVGSTAPPLQPSSARAPCHHPPVRRRCCQLANLQPLPLHDAAELERAV